MKTFAFIVLGLVIGTSLSNTYIPKVEDFKYIFELSIATFIIAFLIEKIKKVNISSLMRNSIFIGVLSFVFFHYNFENVYNLVSVAFLELSFLQGILFLATLFSI